MVSYFIADQQEITDPETMKIYSAGVAATINQYGGKFTVRGGDPETLEGNWPVNRIIILEFENRSALKAWYDTPQYAHLKAMRLASSRSNAIIVDSV